MWFKFFVMKAGNRRRANTRPGKREFSIPHFECLFLILYSSVAGGAADSLAGKKTVAEWDTLLTLNESVSTATRKPRPLKHTPASVSIINREMMDAMAAHNVDDYLVTERGVIVKRPVGIAENVPTDINLRGVPGTVVAARTLILVDGIPTNVSGTPFLILHEVPVEPVKKIEIVRGPFSSLYGANAFGGVINIITEDGQGPLTLDVNGETGNAVFWNGNTWLRGEGKAASYSVSGGVRGIANFFGRDSVLQRNGKETHYVANDNFDYWDVRLFNKFRFPMGEKNRLTLHLRYFQSELGLSTTSNTLPEKDVITEGRKFVLAPVFERELPGGGSFQTGGFFRMTAGEYYREDIAEKSGPTGPEWRPTYWEALSTDGQAQGLLSLPLGKNQLLTAGFESLWNNIRFGAVLDRDSRKPLEDSREFQEDIISSGVFIQDEMAFFDRLFIVPGLRADYHSEFGVAVSPRLGLLYELARPLRLRASAGRGFRAPSLTELYMPDLLVSSNVFFISNKKLEPEHIWSFDGGFILLPFKNLMFQGDAFYNRMSDFIMPRFSSVDSAAVRVSFENSDRAVSMGFDSELSWQPFRSFLGFANYTYTYSEDRRSKGELDYQPAHRANAGLTFHFKANNFSIDAGVTEAFVGERSYQDWETWKGNVADLSSMRPQRVYLDRYWRTDLTFKATYRNRLWAGVSVQNLTDAEFEEMGGFAVPARFVTLKVGGRI